MAETFEYRTVLYDRDQQSRLGMTEAEGIVEVLNLHGSDGWELVMFDDTPNGKIRNLYLKRRRNK